MSINKTVDGENTIITFTYEAPTQKVTDTLTDAAKYLYEHGYPAGVELEEGETSADLSDGEIGTICDNYVKTVLKDAATTYNTNKAKDTAGETADSEADSKYY